MKEKEKIPQPFNDEECRKNRLRQQGLAAHFGTMKTLLRQDLAIRRQDDKDGNVCREGATTDALFEYIKDILVRCQLDLKKLIGMTFDGAMAMKSLAKKIKSEINESAIFIHCLAHCQELIFKDATKHCPALGGAQALYEDLYVIVGISPKRVALFAKIQDEIDSDDVLRLQNLFRTRWTTRGAAGYVITLKHAELLATLKIISEDKNTDNRCKAKAKGLITTLEKTRHMFNMFLMRDVAYILEMNSKNLQKYDVTVEEALDCVNRIEIRLAKMRSSAQEFEKVVTVRTNLQTMLTNTVVDDL